MKPVKLAVLALAAAAGLSACSDRNAPSSPLASSSASLASVAANGKYMVLFKGNGVPANFASQVRSLGGTVLYSHAKAGFALVRGLSAAGAAQVGARSDVADLQADQVVSLAAPTGTARATAPGAGIESQANPASAILASWQWNMKAIGADKAWAAGKLGSPSVTAAILDTGLDYGIRDLVGLVDLSRSVSFVPEDDTLAAHYFGAFPALQGLHPVQDFNGHGTNVATQVSSKAFAFAGVTSRTTLIGVKVLGANGSGDFGAILAGVLYAADHGADVANMSLGGSFPKAGGNGSFAGFINRTMNYAKQQGMLVVVSAGNDGADLDHDGNTYVALCNATNVICVSSVGLETATGSPDVPAFYTNFGRSAITVAAPGGNAKFPLAVSPGWAWGADIASWVWSFCSRTSLNSDEDTGEITGSAGCESGGRLTGNIGTSQASPHVTGLAALLIAEGGKGNPSQIRSAILKSADDLGQPGTDPFYGKGRINVARALSLN